MTWRTCREDGKSLKNRADQHAGALPGKNAPGFCRISGSIVLES
jgi:hypothetical protein